MEKIIDFERQRPGGAGGREQRGLKKYHFLFEILFESIDLERPGQAEQVAGTLAAVTSATVTLAAVTSAAAILAAVTPAAVTLTAVTLAAMSLAAVTLAAVTSLS